MFRLWRIFGLRLRFGTWLAFCSGAACCLPFLGSVDCGLMQSKIMVGKLCVGFGGNALARCGCIMGQRQIFFVELLALPRSFTSGPLDS